MFKIKKIYYDKGYKPCVDYGTETYTTIEKAINALKTEIKSELKCLNSPDEFGEPPENEFKVNFQDEQSLLTIDEWEGREDTDGDRDILSSIEYDIVYCGNELLSLELDNEIPEKWIN